MHASLLSRTDSSTLDAVFQRTAAGQSELLSVRPRLAPGERTLLAVLTGFTPVSALLSLLGEAPATLASLQKMQAMGLIQSAEGKMPQHFFLGWPCAQWH